MLGDHAAQLELVAEESGVSLYILDGGAENFIRIEQIAISAELEGRSTVFYAKENSATGEVIGDSSQFVAVQNGVSLSDRFPVRIDEIVVRGQTFSGVEFSFPEGKH